MMPELVVKHCQNELFALVCFNVLLLLALTNVVTAGEAVKYLPGFDGELPFNLETGYIGVGESNASQMFYLFVESQRSPALDPLMLWLTGGPGCSVLSAFFYEHGPVAFNYGNYDGSLPSLHLNSMTWTQSLNIIYLDQPVGTGFSYSLTEENYYVNDTKSAAQTYEFLRKWLLEHPQYLTNQLFIGGDSYSGVPVPIIVQNIFDGNKAGLDPYMNIKGYILGNPKTDNFIDENSNLPFAYQLTLISEELFQEAKLYCGGDYVNIDPNNTACVTAIGEYKELVQQINVLNILEPNCQAATPNKTNTARRELEVDPDIVRLAKLRSAYWCRQYNYVLSAVWANNPLVRDALHVREHTKEVWKRCNFSHAYTKTVTSTVPYHRNLSKQSLLAMVYSGDHDFSITHIGTQNWIRTLNLTTDEEWRPWFVDSQVAGYTVKYINGNYTLIFATVKGAGHTAPEYKPKECYSMINRFFASFPL